MKVWNLSVNRGADGSKHLDVQVHGVIDGEWFGMDDGVATNELIAALNQHRDAKTIGVRINSVGGSAFGGVALYNALQSHPGEVSCFVEGLAASAASLIAMAGKCTMGLGAMMMIHSPLSIMMGNAQQLRAEADRLDKVQDALAGIYTAKTGKGLDEINEMLDQETWMSAEEAVAAGFADAMGGSSGEEQEPDPNDPNEGNEDEENLSAGVPHMVGDDRIEWRGAVFPAASVPRQIAAMAIADAPDPAETEAPPADEPVEPEPTPETPDETPPEPAPAPTAASAAKPSKAKRSRAPRAAAPALKVVPPPAPLTQAEIELRAPDILKAAREEGRAAGMLEERARLKAIDELGVIGCAEIVAAAKYGDTPTDATTLAVAVVKAGKQAGAELLARRRVDSRPLAAVVAGAPDKTASSEEARVIQAMVQGGDSRRGGNTR